MEAEIETHHGGPARATDTRREERRRAILDAAEAMFVETDFARVSLGAIVRRSGGSLATVYEMFGNKQGLLRAVVNRHKDRGFGELLAMSEGPCPAETLRCYANRCHAFVTSPRTLALMRIVIGESLTDPEFGRAFHEDMNDDATSQLSECFRQWTAEGKARIDDPEAAAQLFIAMVLCDAPLKSLLGGTAAHHYCGEIEWRLAPFLEHFRIADAKR